MSNEMGIVQLAREAHGLATEMIRYVDAHYVRIPETVCTCGKPVVFSSDKNHFICDRCKKEYRLVVEVTLCE